MLELIVLCTTFGFLMGCIITWFIIDWSEVHGK